MPNTVKCSDEFYDLQKAEDCRKLLMNAHNRVCTKPVTMDDFDIAKQIIGMVMLSGPDSVQQNADGIHEDLIRRECHMLFSGMLEVPVGPNAVN